MRKTVRKFGIAVCACLLISAFIGHHSRANSATIRYWHYAQRYHLEWYEIAENGRGITAANVKKKINQLIKGITVFS